METPLQPERATLMRGIVIGLLVLSLAILLSGLYLWGSLLSDVPAEEPWNAPSNTEPETPRADADIQILNTVSGSDDVPAIEADLESTTLDSLDKELDLIENDLDQQERR